MDSPFRTIVTLETPPTSPGLVRISRGKAEARLSGPSIIEDQPIPDDTQMAAPLEVPFTSGYGPASGHTFMRVTDAAAGHHRVMTSGLKVYIEAWGRPEDPVTYWGPERATAPGVVAYRYTFGQKRLAKATLSVRTSAWDYTTGKLCCGEGKGTVVVEASKDGEKWEQWAANKPVAQVKEELFTLTAPDHLLGGHEFWVRLTMESSSVDSYANGQVARADARTQQPGYSFQAALE